MLPKQKEMDGIVKEIYEAMTSQPHLQNALLIVCGDHGMNDAGNHGASSAGETSPALVFISPKLTRLPTHAKAPLDEREDFRYYSFVEQSDLAPTLAALLGFPIPKNNLGAFIADLLPLWADGRDRAQILLRNAQQILTIVMAAFGSDMAEADAASAACQSPSTEIQQLACAWDRVSKSAPSAAQGSGGQLDAEWVADISRWLHDAQGLMSSMASNYDMPMLITGQVLGVTAALCAAAALLLFGGETADASGPFAFIVGSYAVMMFASSYVEEEHHFWYWSATAWLALITIQGLNTYVYMRLALSFLYSSASSCHLS